MATWVTHLMIADRVLKSMPDLDRRGFCVGNIAPDCNVENEDWTEFTPPREVTHWMSGSRKSAADCERFYAEYAKARVEKRRNGEETSFLLGYYAHLIADAQFQKLIRDEDRVKAMWERIRGVPELMARADGLDESWDSAKKMVSKRERLHEIEIIEAEYLNAHPDSGYLTEILPLKSFPDYIGDFPEGSIVRKIGVMGGIPRMEEHPADPVLISREEYNSFVKNTALLVTNLLREKGF